MGWGVCFIFALEFWVLLKSPGVRVGKRHHGDGVGGGRAQPSQSECWERNPGIPNDYYTAAQRIFDECRLFGKLKYYVRVAFCEAAPEEEGS